jgi:tetratricopeptide (TPR) repeat protein
MKNATRVVAVLLFSGAVCVSSIACLWDYDTLEMERREFPDTLELITGKFLRHSEAFYEWRVADREKRFAEESSPELYDDLAVAHEKLGHHDKAIELMRQKQVKFPGLYETHANLGTFYIHAGELERGIEEIEKAIEINPDAHFGREIYQKRLVEYVMRQRASNAASLPLDLSERYGHEPRGFAEFVVKKTQDDTWESREAESKRALKGVLGMMRFGNFDSPVLLEALGDLLLARGDELGAKRLAARAYLKASYEAESSAAQGAYRRMAKQCLEMQLEDESGESRWTLKKLENIFKAELVQADRWYAQVVADEEEWIRQGIDVDAAFSKKYYEEPTVVSFDPGWASYAYSKWWALLIILGLLVGLVWFVRRSRRPPRDER